MKMMTRKKVNHAWTLGILAVFLIILAAGMKGTFTVKAADVSLVRGERVEYIGYSTHYYYINGNLAYCLEPDMDSPGNGTYPSGEMSPDQLLAKAMYYVYGGPGFEANIKPLLTGGWDAPDRSYCLSHCILSYIYDGCDPNSSGFIGLNEDIKGAVITFTEHIKNLPSVPEQELSLSQSELQAYFSPEEKRQRTDVVICQGDPANSVTFPLAEGMTLVNVTKQTEQQGNVAVQGGDQFYLAADVAYQNGGAWESGPVKASLSQAWRTLIVQTGGSSQDVGSGQLITVEPSEVSLGVKWLEKPELTIEKHADKADKTYQVGDLITYTTDVTQRIQNAVAKNVVITDTILTEGVKLQKNSVVLLDAGQNRIEDAVIQVTGNSFSIHAGEFLQSADLGEKYTVEYQVMIVDEGLIGKEIENEVVVRADNAEEEKDREIVEVPEPEPEPEPEPQPGPEPESQPEPQPEPEPQVQEMSVKAPSVKTGDEQNLTLLAIFLILSCAVIFICVKIPSKTKK